MAVLDALPLLIDDFSGGLNTRAHPLAVGVNESPNCINVYSTIFKALQKRQGREEVNATATGASDAGNGLYWFGADENTKKLIAHFGTSLYKMDGLDGTYDSIKTGIPSDISHFENFNGTLIVSGEGRYVPQSWNGVAPTTSDLSDAPIGTIFKAWRDRLYAIGMVDAPSRVDFSTGASFSDWSSSGSGSFTVATNDGDFFRGFGELRGLMYIFKRFSIVRVTYTGGSPLHTAKIVVSKVGCDSPETIRNVNIPGVGEVIIFLGTDGILYTFDGSDVNPISTKFDVHNGIAPVNLGRINPKKISLAHASVDRENGWYVLFFPQDAETTCSSGIIWNYFSGAGWPLDNQTFGASTVVEKGSGGFVILASDYNGQTFEVERGNSDDGSNINGQWESAHFRGKGMDNLIRFHHIDFIIKATGNHNITFKYRQDWNTSYTTGDTINVKGSTNVLGDNLPLTLGGQSVVKVTKGLGKLGGGITGNHIQIQVQSNTTNKAFRFDAINFRADPRRPGTQRGH